MGHLVGDKVLVDFSKKTRASLRETASQKRTARARLRRYETKRRSSNTRKNWLARHGIPGPVPRNSGAAGPRRLILASLFLCRVLCR